MITYCTNDYNKLSEMFFEKLSKENTKYTIDEAIDIAKQKSIDAINSKLNDKEYIISSKNLKVEIKESKIILEMFFSVYEDITDYRVIEDINYQEQEWGCATKNNY